MKQKAKLYLASAWARVVDIRRWFDIRWYKFLLKKRRAAKSSLSSIREELEDVGYCLMTYDEKSIWDYSEAMMHIMMALTKLQELDEKQLAEVKQFEEEI